MKRMKKLIALSLAAVMIFGNAVLSVSAAELSNDELVKATTAELNSRGTYTYTNAAQVSRLVQQGYACNQSTHKGPFSITKAVLTTSGWFGKTNKKDVYVVALSGTDTDVENQTTGYWTDLLVGFEFDNKYNKNVKQAILSNVPLGSNLFITGHSLGGMVAQQIASDTSIKENYNVLNTVTFGSPLINGFKREGTVKRLGDTSDVIPYMSLTTFTNVVWQSAGLNKEDGGYGTDLLGAHCESYNRDSVWGDYDVTGTKNGDATLTLNYATTQFYYSPVTVTE